MRSFRPLAVVTALLLLLFGVTLPLRSDAGSIGTDGRISFSSGGGLSTGVADSTYLRLDASNDPLTGDLSITGNVLPGTDANLDLGSSTLSWDQLYVRYLMDQAGATRIDMPETDTMVFTSTESVTAGQDIGYRFNLTNNLSTVNDIHTVWYDSTPTALLTLMEDGELRFGWHGTETAPNITSGSGYGIFFTNANVGISANGTETAALFSTSGIELSSNGPDFIWTTASGNNAAGNIALYSGANANGEISVTTGTSNNTAVGVKLEKWCIDCDSAATEIGYITDGGDLQIDGEFLASAGAVGTPSISFLNDPDTGLYNSTTNTLAFTAGGTSVMTLTPDVASFTPSKDNGASFEVSATTNDVASSDVSSIKLTSIMDSVGGDLTNVLITTAAHTVDDGVIRVLDFVTSLTLDAAEVTNLTSIYVRAPTITSGTGTYTHTGILVAQDTGATAGYAIDAQGAVRAASLTIPASGIAGSPITESLKASGTLDFGSIAAQTCADLTMTLTNAGANDPVACSWPAALETGLSGTCWISAADTAKFRLCNVTTGAIDPASATYGARTIQ